MAPAVIVRIERYFDGDVNKVIDKYWEVWYNNTKYGPYFRREDADQQADRLCGS